MLTLEKVDYQGTPERLPGSRGTPDGLPGAAKWDTDCVKVCSLMSAMSRPAIEPPHEPAGSRVLSDLYGDYDVYDDISGASLDHKLASAARKT